jgi:hypothetical protein
VLLSCALLGSLSACQPQPEENVQVRAENASRALEQRYRQIEAEAENRTNAAIDPLDNEADALLAQMGNGFEANTAVNSQ